MQIIIIIIIILICCCCLILLGGFYYISYSSPNNTQPTTTNTQSTTINTQSVPTNTQSEPTNTQLTTTNTQPTTNTQIPTSMTASTNTQSTPMSTKASIPVPTSAPTPSPTTPVPISYITYPILDQDGQTIQTYNNDINQCQKDCSTNDDCNGYTTHNDGTCWTIKNFPSPYINQVSTIYKKSKQPKTQSPSYLSLSNLDQDGQTIQSYNNISQCQQDCTTNNVCSGYITHTDGNCWTIKKKYIHNKIKYSIKL